MERPNAQTTAWYDGLVPTDPRARRGQMFGHPCAFVNGNMFFGTFAQTLVARVGPERADALVRVGVRVFMPMEGRAWKEYVQIERGALPDTEVAALAEEALAWTSGLPAKPEKAAKAKKPAAPRARRAAE